MGWTIMKFTEIVHQAICRPQIRYYSATLKGMDIRDDFAVIQDW